MKSQLKLLTGAAVSLSAITTLSAAPLVALGDGAALFFKGTASAEYQSNIFRDADDEESDTIFIFTPGLELEIGRVSGSTLSGTISIAEQFKLYSDNSDLDTENFLANAALDYRGGSLSASLMASFAQLDSTSATSEANVPGIIVEREESRLKGYAEYTFSSLLSVGAGAGYFKQDYTTAGFIDSETYTVPADIYYELSPKLDLSVGYVYKTVEFDAANAAEFDSHFFNVGARGEILPKLSGRAKVGFELRDVENDDSKTTYAMEAALSYVPTSLLTIDLGLDRSYQAGSTATGSVYTNTEANLAARYAITNMISTSARAFYAMRNYDAGSLREDDVYGGGISVNYDPNDYVTFSAGYTYTKVDSNVDAISYDNNILNVSASLRY